MFFEQKDPQTVIESLDKALELLQKRYEQKTITIQEFSKKCEELGKKREKYLKKLKKNELK